MRILAIANIFKYERENYLLAYDVTSNKKIELVALKASFVIPTGGLIQINNYEEEEIKHGKIAHIQARKIIKIKQEFVSFIQDDFKFLKQVLPLLTKRITKTNALLHLIAYHKIKKLKTTVSLYTSRMTREEAEIFRKIYDNSSELFQEALKYFVNYVYMLYLVSKAEDILDRNSIENNIENSWKAVCQSVLIKEDTFFEFIKEFFIDDVYDIVAKEDISSFLKKAQSSMLSLIKQISIYRKSNKHVKMYDFDTVTQEKALDYLEKNNSIIIVTGPAGTGKSELLLKLKEKNKDRYILTAAVKETAEKRLNSSTIQALICNIRKKDKKTLSEITNKVICVDESSYLSAYDLVTLLSLYNQKVIKGIVLVGDIHQTRIASHPSLLSLLSLVLEIRKLELEKNSYRFQELNIVIDSMYDTENHFDLSKISTFLDTDVLKLCISAGYQNDLKKVINDIKLVNEVQGLETNESVLFLKYYVKGQKAIKSIYTAITRAKKTAYTFLHKKESEKVWSLIENINDIINQKYQNVKVNFLYNGHIVDFENKEYRSMTDEEKAQWLEKIPRLKLLYPEIFSEILSESEVVEVENQPEENSNLIHIEKDTPSEPIESLHTEATAFLPSPWQEWNMDEVEVFNAGDVVIMRKDTEMVFVDEDDFTEWVEKHLEKEFPESRWLSKKTEKTLSVFTSYAFEDEKIQSITNRISHLTALLDNQNSNNYNENKKETKRRGRKLTTSLKILNILREHPEGLTFKEIYALTKITRSTLEKLLSILKKQGKIKYEGGKYMVSDEKKIDRMDQNIQDIKEIVTEIRSLVLEIVNYYRKKEEELTRLRRPQVNIDISKIRH